MNQFQAAVLTVLELDNPDFVLVDDSVTRCLVDSWQRRVSVYNEGDDTGTAADIASRQVDSIYLDPGTDQFFTDISEAINAKNSEVKATPTSINILSWFCRKGGAFAPSRRLAVRVVNETMLQPVP